MTPDRLIARRTSRHAIILLAALGLVGIAACGGTEPPPEQSHSPGTPAARDDAPGTGHFLDAAGTRHPTGEPARRIVSLVPSATATIRALGAEHLLVGRTDYDVDAWVSEVPSVGGGLEPNLEVLLSLRPDVVIRFEGEQDPRTPRRLDELGIRHVAVRPSSLADIHATTSIVGHLTGRTSAADSLSQSIRKDLAAVATSVAALPRRTVLYTLGGTPPWVAGPGTFVSEILSLAGGDNVFDDLAAPWSAVSPEVVRTRAIDVVLVPRAGVFDRALAPDARIVAIGSLLDIPGPDVAESARRVAALLHDRPSH